MKKLAYIFLLICFVLKLSGQNLLTNANFKENQYCPTFFSEFTVIDWVVPTFGTSDYYHECALDPLISVPSNYAGFQNSNAGGAYVGLITKYATIINYREYIQAEFSSPLEAGCYNLKIFYSNADAAGYANNLGMYLSVGQPDPNGYFNIDPQMEETNIIQNQTDWLVLSGQYTTTGGETHVTIGNFRNDAETGFIPGTGVEATSGYVYIDSVLVEFAADEITEIDVNIGQDMMVCESDFPITISSNFPNLNNSWNTGENTSTIEITQAGNYSVDVVGDCSLGTDEITIEIIQEPALELGNEVFLCEGDEYTFTLDPTLGNYEWSDGTIGPDKVIDEPGSYTVSLTYDCGVITDNIDFTIIPSIPDVNIDDIVICADQLPYFLNVGAYENTFNTIEWSNGTNGSNGVFFGDGNYEVVIYNDCFTVRDSFSIESSPILPFEYLTDDYTACEGEDLSIFPDIIDAFYEWSDGSTELYFNAPGPGVYSVTLTNFCGSISYDFEVLEPEEAVFDLGENLSICPGDSVLLTTSLGLVLEWNTGDFTDSLWVEASGLYIASYMDQCGVIMDSIAISLDGAAPELSLTDSLLLCIGDSILLSSTQQTSGISFLWNTGETTAEIQVKESGNYIVEASNNCGIRVDSVYIKQGEAAPVLNLEASQTICKGDSLEIGLNLDDVTILWSNGSNADTITFFDMGEYWVEVSNSCATVSDTIRIETLDLPLKPDAGLDVGLCEGDSIELIANNVGTEILWNTSDTTDNIWVQQAGTYIISNINACGELSDTILVENLGQAPKVDIGSDIIFCQGDTVFLEIEDIYTNITWSSGGQSNIESIITEQELIVVVENICGTASDTINLIYSEEAPQIYLGPDKLLCEGDSVLLESDLTGGIINWNTGEQGAEIYVQDAGQYIATYESSCGDSADSILVEIAQSTPIPNLGPDTTICFIDDLLLQVDVPDNIEILWSNNSMNAELLAFFEGTYWVELTGLCGTTRDSIVIDNYPILPGLELANDTIICEEEFEIEPTMSLTDVEYLWSTGATTEELIVNESGTYWLAVSNPCELRIDTIEVLFETSPEPFEFSAPDTLCFGEKIVLAEDQGDGFSYLWNTSNAGTSQEITESGTYWLTIQNFCGEVSDTQRVYIRSPYYFDLEFQDAYEACPDELVEIDLTGLGVEEIIWDNNDMDLIKSLGVGQYEVMLFSECKDSIIRFSINPKICVEDIKVFIPNVFSPNEDGINDNFEIYFPENYIINRFEIQVYNRWGEQVYSTEDPNFSWDGTTKEQRINPGVFVYYLNAEIEVEEQSISIQRNGDITIIK